MNLPITSLGKAVKLTKSTGDSQTAIHVTTGFKNRLGEGAGERGMAEREEG